MSESIELQVNLNTLLRDGWCVEMETGVRGGQIRSWVKLRHWDRGLSFKVRAAPQEIKAALAMAMREAGIEPFSHRAATETPAAQDRAIEIERLTRSLSEVSAAYGASQPPSESSSLQCPFCRESDFDAVGLKFHLFNHCERFDDVDTLDRPIGKVEAP